MPKSLESRDRLFYRLTLVLLSLALVMQTCKSQKLYYPHEDEVKVIKVTENCDILRGVDKGQYYYVTDCTPNRLSQRGPLPYVKHN
jgi:hypothetical protein